MIIHPENYIQRTADLGIMMMTVHAEACTNLKQTICDIHNAGMKAGVALNPQTDVSVVEDVLEDADMFLPMSVNPGYSGQKYIEGSELKIKQLRTLLNACNSKALIQVDGGINKETTPLVVEAGADVVVCGNYIFKAENPQATIQSLKRIT